MTLRTTRVQKSAENTNKSVYTPYFHPLMSEQGTR